MKRVQKSMYIGMLTTLLSFLLLATGDARAASLACGAWSVVTSPNAGSNDNVLLAVAAISANDVWAVGHYQQTNNGPFLTLTEHWNGTQWSVVPSPDVGIGPNELLGVAAVSATNVWAVGYYQKSNGVVKRSLIEHWNGTSWAVVQGHNFGTLANALNGVTALSASDIWAVGYHTNIRGVFLSLVEHWNGTQWSVVKSPSPDPLGNSFSSVAAISPTDVWAVGGGGYASLIEHWNGTRWSVVSNPNVGSNENYLPAVAAVTANDIWTVGVYMDDSFVYHTLVEQWNGTRWSVVPSPNLGPKDNLLLGVAAISTTNVWAVGYNITDSTIHSSFYGTLIEHWDGTSWSIVPSPNPGILDSELYGVLALSNTLWAVGEYTNIAGSQQTLTEFYC